MACYIPPPLGARRPRRHTSAQRLALIPNLSHPDPGFTTSWELPKGLVIGARRPRRHTSDKGLALIPNCHIPAKAPTTFRARLHRSTILSTLAPNHAFMVLFLRTSQWIIHHGIALTRYSLNFEVPMEPEANELLKGLVLESQSSLFTSHTRNPNPLKTSIEVAMLIYKNPKLTQLKLRETVYKILVETCRISEPKPLTYIPQSEKTDRSVLTLLMSSVVSRVKKALGLKSSFSRSLSGSDSVSQGRS
ncbi:hypothetical protein TB1_016205 [Malus domestica]